jgi:hypothetical protein
MTPTIYPAKESPLESGFDLQYMIEVAAEDVSERIDAMSGMTDMTTILTKKEIRDVLAFLMTLKKRDS